MRVAIAEDAVVFRDGLARLLEDRGHDVVAAVGDGGSLVQAVVHHRPDAVIVDVRMPPTYTDDGLHAAIEVRRVSPTTGVLVFSQYIETRYAARLLALGAGGVGYLLKDRVADTSDFIDALTRVAAGGTALDPEVVTQLVAASDRVAAMRTTLTDRETQVLGLMAEGRSNAAIATQLRVAEGSVEKHVANIFTKLGLPASQTDNRRVLAVLRYLET